MDRKEFNDSEPLLEKMPSESNNGLKVENLDFRMALSNPESNNLYEKNLTCNLLNEGLVSHITATPGVKEDIMSGNGVPIEERKTDGTLRKYKILSGCKFCDIIHNNSGKIIFEDEHCAAFYDKKKKSAKCHILVCSKDHIKNSHDVPKDNISILLQIQKAGEDLLKKLWPDESYRFGYHEPPMNSVDHLHLHCLVPPIKVKYLDHVVYGIKLAPTDKIISKILNDEIGIVKAIEAEISKEKQCQGHVLS